MVSSGAPLSQGDNLDSHSTYGFYDSEPPYEQVREEAEQILADRKQAINKTMFSKPHPIPGEE